MTTPSSGREGDIYIDGTKVGYVKGFSASAKAELVKDYSQDSVKPALVAPGNQSIKFDIDTLWIGNDYLTMVFAGASHTIVLSGATGGNVTLTGAILTDWKLDKKLTGAIGQSISGEAADMT